MSVEIIAEIGENHGGNIIKARSMIRQAAWAGVNTVKFQSYNAACIKKDDPERDWFLKVALSDDDHVRLKEVADKCGVKFLSSPFSRERSDFLVKGLGLSELKIASCMMYNEEFLKHVNSLAKCGLKKIYVSTGMASWGDIMDCLAWLDLRGVEIAALFHCVSLYPCPIEVANLSAVACLKSEWPFPTGYSDHTVGIDACIAAVALGAKVIEKHFTLDKKCKEGTDHVFSAEPQEFAEMVERIRKVELMLGDGVKRPTPGELEIKEFMKNRFIV